MTCEVCSTNALVSHAVAVVFHYLRRKPNSASHNMGAPELGMMRKWGGEKKTVVIKVRDSLIGRLGFSVTREPECKAVNNYPTWRFINEPRTLHRRSAPSAWRPSWSKACVTNAFLRQHCWHPGSGIRTVTLNRAGQHATNRPTEAGW